jgi:hypothetical protein
MAKEALTQHRFASYTSVIEAETLGFIEKVGLCLLYTQILYVSLIAAVVGGIWRV